MSKQNKNIAFVDVLRILACITVVACHCRFYLPGDNNTKMRVLLAAFTADGVSIFWMITGMFYFRDMPYKERVKKMFKRIVLPILIMSFIIFYFNEFLIGNTSLIGSIMHPLRDYKILLKDYIFTWTPIKYLGHLWYLYTYIILVLLHPVLNKIREYIDTLDYKKVILFMFAILLLNDISLNKLLTLSLHGTTALIASLFFFFTGYLLYKNNDKIRDKEIIKYIIIFVITNGIRGVCSYLVLRENVECRELLKWYSSFGLVSTVSIYMIIRNIMSKITVDDVGNAILKHCSKLTLYIYLVHCNVMYVMDYRGISSYLLIKSKNIIVYLILYFLIVFVVSCTISKIVLFIKYIFNKIKNAEKNT